jgi:D-arginine dehydrogenase
MSKEGRGMDDLGAGYDIAVIGAGIAGASAAAELAKDARVLLLEMEAQPGYHTTGRSAAMFAPGYGPRPIRALTRASASFYAAPPAGFCDTPLLRPRDVLMLARPDQTAAAAALLAELQGEIDIADLDAAAVEKRVPLLRPGYAAQGVLDRSGSDIDVHALHQGYLRAFRALGGELVTKAEVQNLTRLGDIWQIKAGGQTYEASSLVNAAGAWAEKIGDLAGAEPIGLIPKRRTALIVATPDGIKADDLPLVVDIDEQFYLKPDAGRLLISPANEDPEQPCDAQPDEMDIALCIDRIERAFDLPVRRIETKWAGLRSFVADKCPVAGFSQAAPGFFWLAGQGG